MIDETRSFTKNNYNFEDNEELFYESKRKRLQSSIRTRSTMESEIIEEKKISPFEKSN
jgi:hypothetical protein